MSALYLTALIEGSPQGTRIDTRLHCTALSGRAEGVGPHTPDQRRPQHHREVMQQIEAEHSAKLLIQIQTQRKSAAEQKQTSKRSSARTGIHASH